MMDHEHFRVLDPPTTVILSSQLPALPVRNPKIALSPLFWISRSLTFCITPHWAEWFFCVHIQLTWMCICGMEMDKSHRDYDIYSIPNVPTIMFSMFYTFKHTHTHTHTHTLYFCSIHISHIIVKERLQIKSPWTDFKWRASLKSEYQGLYQAATKDINVFDSLEQT